MADKVLFEVDASKIIAKLHLAGLMAVRDKFNSVGEDGGFIVNTGIVDDNAKGNPEDPGKTTFNLKNPSSEYQVGYITTISYKKDYGAQKRIKDLQKAIEQKVGNKSKIDDKADSDVQKAFDDAIDKLKTMFSGPDAKVKLDDSVFDGLNGDEYEKSLAQIKKAMQKAMEENAKQYEGKINELKKKVQLNILLPYMQTFAGADNVNIVDSDIMKCNISESAKDSNSKGLVSSLFTIEPMKEAEQAKLEATFRQKLVNKPDEDNCKHKICFYVKYMLNVDK